MSSATTATLAKLDEVDRRSMDWLLVYSLERNGGIDEGWLRDSGLSQGEAEQLLSDNPEL